MFYFLGSHYLVGFQQSLPWGCSKTLPTRWKAQSISICYWSWRWVGSFMPLRSEIWSLWGKWGVNVGPGAIPKCSEANFLPKSFPRPSWLNAKATYNKKGLFGKENHAKFYTAGVVVAFNHLHSHLVHVLLEMSRGMAKKGPCFHPKKTHTVRGLESSQPGIMFVYVYIIVYNSM